MELFIVLNALYLLQMVMVGQTNGNVCDEVVGGLYYHFPEVLYRAYLQIYLLH